MKDIFFAISSILYVIIGLVCLLMAYKNIQAKKFLPFHQESAGRSWESIDIPLQNVIITILRISGLGFLVVSILLISLPIVNYFKRDVLYQISVPVLSILFCSGLFVFNFQLYKKTKADTPWKGSLIAIFLLIVSLILSII
jgi:hypothetical protein